uniref:Uncharacterized protein n=1 Tax=Oryza sativa subsp. japonica TaxID=39947 RepID=Q6K529_ORYSJ|nr:hypothetical protein [Oryza sativa Japonica Group]BAD28202.1 hypothetical protein [Oryza sativa Japonica Group]
MGLRDGFSNNKLLDDFGCGDLTRPEHVFRRDRNHHRHRQLGLSSSPKPQDTRRTKRCQIMSNEYAIRVIAPNLPTKTDNLSHSTGHGWTTREKVVNGQFFANVVGLITQHDCERTSGYAISWWPSYDYCLVLDQRCSDSPTTSISIKLIAGKFYSTLRKTPCLYGSTPRSTKASTTNVDKASSQTLHLLDRLRTVAGSRQGIRNEEMVYSPRYNFLTSIQILDYSKTGDLVVHSVLSWSTSEIDLDKPFRCPHEADKGSLTLSLNSPRTVT